MEVRLVSSEDASVNFVRGTGKRLIEARYVRRSAEELTVYLSSQTGCRMGCRMCHLTQTRQVSDDDVEVEQLMAQARSVLDYYNRLGQPARIVHFNFMARGEPLSSNVLLAQADQVIDQLGLLAADHGLIPSYKVSTILPRKTMASRQLTDIFRRTQPDIYYSLYSLSPNFRRRWLPAALEPLQALEVLARWQQVTHKIPVLHWAFIAGENDSPEDIEAICQAVNQTGLRTDFNIVRYNPFSEAFGRETDISLIRHHADHLQAGVPGSRVQIVSRVGTDVQASCGMFVKPNM